jgi:hypothetical protein
MHARAGGGAFNLFNHFDPRDVQNNLTSARFGGSSIHLGVNTAEKLFWSFNK